MRIAEIAVNAGIAEIGAAKESGVNWVRKRTISYGSGRSSLL